MTSENIHEQDKLSDKAVEALYRRHVQGAYVRSFASLACWLFVGFFFMIDEIDIDHLIGISLAILYLILINPPTLWLLRHTQYRRYWRYISLAINLLEIGGYTVIIYFMGGIEAANMTLLYAALIAYAGAVSHRVLPFILAAACSASFSLLVVLVHLRVLPNSSPFYEQTIAWEHQILILVVTIGFLFVVAFISSYTASLLKGNREKLRAQFSILAKANERLQDEMALSSKIREELATSEKLFRAITENMQELISIIDLNGVYRYISPIHTKVTGYKPEELLGKLGLDFIHPDDVDNALKNLEKGLTDLQSRSIEMRFRVADGSYLWIETMGSPIFEMDGSFKEIILCSRDISERRQAEARIRASEEQFRSVSMYAHDGIMIVNNNAEVSFWNTGAEKITGYSQKEMTDRCVYELLAMPGDKQAYERAFHAWRASGRGASMGRARDIMVRRKSGEEISVEMSISSILMADQWHAVGIFRNVTERRQLEKQLRQHVEETEKMNQLMRGRENRVLELKGVINDLLIRLGEAPRYPAALKYNLEQKELKGVG